MNHSELNELYELYLLGILESEQTAEINQHLSDGCEHCQNGLRQASALLGTFAGLTEMTTPPARLRDRVLSISRLSAATKSPRWPLAFVLACAASLALLAWGIWQHGANDRTLAALQDMRQQRNELRAAVEILSQSDARAVNFGGAQTAPHGRVFLSPAGGVVFVGSRLPELASGKTFELWLVPAKGNPQAAGTFQRNTQGVSVNVLTQSIDLASYAAVAVSIEPVGGSPQPTTKPFLIVPLA